MSHYKVLFTLTDVVSDGDTDNICLLNTVQSVLNQWTWLTIILYVTMKDLNKFHWICCHLRCFKFSMTQFLQTFVHADEHTLQLQLHTVTTNCTHLTKPRYIIVKHRTFVTDGRNTAGFNLVCVLITYVVNAITVYPFLGRAQSKCNGTCLSSSSTVLPRKSLSQSLSLATNSVAKQAT